jgi:uncharacterized protein YndB with AHSA1/START domain
MKLRENSNRAEVRLTPLPHRSATPVPPAGVGRRCLLQVRHGFAHPPERVFGAWLDASSAARWLFATAGRPHAEARTDPRRGGRFSLVDRQGVHEVRYGGAYLLIVAPRHLAFTWSGPQARASRVDVRVARLRNGCELQLAHANVPTRHAAWIEERWMGSLYGLAVTLAEAADADETQRKHAMHPLRSGGAG